jgi:hypothetical protein
MTWSKKKTAALVAIVLLLGTFAAAQAVKSFAKEAAGPLRIFTDVLAQIHSKYVEEVDTTELLYSALDGMLSNLDPHSGFMRPRKCRKCASERKAIRGRRHRNHHPRQLHYGHQPHRRHPGRPGGHSAGRFHRENRGRIDTQPFPHRGREKAARSRRFAGEDSHLAQTWTEPKELEITRERSPSIPCVTRYWSKDTAIST